VDCQFVCDVSLPCMLKAANWHSLLQHTMLVALSHIMWICRRLARSSMFLTRGPNIILHGGYLNVISLSASKWSN